jgi:GT2 family glycosyltransferase
MPVNTSEVVGRDDRVGVVAIGRNEGERLVRCLASVAHQVRNVVYVDSGSTDSSVAFARSLGVAVVLLDLRQPFTAARARNEGFQRLLEIAPDIEFVQFVDGDCEVAPTWFDEATKAMDSDERIGIVCGRRREKCPEKSIYNRLCDMEWNAPIGFTRACGGDSMCRVTAFCECDGFNAKCIAGEEPELCVRLRKANWKVLRINAEMTSHDANMFRFGQWWRRSVRSGHAYAQGRALHGAPPERHGVKESRSIWFWAFAFPLLMLVLAVPLRGLSFIAVLAYPAQILRISVDRHRRFGDPMWQSLAYGISCVLGKWAQLVGQVKFYWNRLRGRRSAIIEYK